MRSVVLVRVLIASRIAIESVCREPTDDERKEMGPYGTYWTVTLTYQGRSMTTPFHMGSAWVSEPEAANVLESLVFDAESITDARDFEDWCGNCGYDTDSREAERTYHACAELGLRVRALLGADYDQAHDELDGAGGYEVAK